MTKEELCALQFIMAMRPWGNSKLDRQVGQFLDGSIDEIKGAPTVTMQVGLACNILRKV